MALVKCPECGAAISKKAEACPQCGHSRRKTSARRSGCGSVLLLLVVLSGGAAAIIGAGSDPQPVAPVSSPPALSAEDQRLQVERQALIEKLQRRGFFYKVEASASGLPHLWVTPQFMALGFDEKQRFVNVVYAYYVTADPKQNIVVLKDGRTGKRIGVYAAEQGGLRLE